MVDGVIGDEADYDRGLRLLESLITGKKRQDGAQWEHAFDMMQCYLEVCWYLYADPCRALTSVGRI